MKPAELRNSHIVPEFLYQRLYDSKHRAAAIKAQPGSCEDMIQKGLREYMLCQNCETQFSRYETYAAKVLRKLPDWSTAEPGQMVVAKDCQYAKFKLFQLSLLWRMGVAHQRSFEQVDLGPHEPVLRRMLFQEDPGRPLEYGCPLISTCGPGRADEFLKPPVRHRINGHITYTAIFHGLIWVFFVSSRATKMREVRSFLSTSGDLPINVCSRTVASLRTGLARALIAVGVV